MANYYCLVSGLKEYALESEQKGFDAVSLRNEIREALTPGDTLHLEMLYTFYDIENIIAHLAGKQHFNPLGNYTPQEIELGLMGNKEEEIELDEEIRPLPSFILRAIAAYNDPEEAVPSEDTDADETTQSTTLEAALWLAFYQTCSRSTCSFIRAWFDFDMTLRNICAAFTARANQWSISEQLVGRGEITAALAKSSSSDFGLRNEIEYIEPIIALLEEKNILEKEHRMDTIRWDKSNDLTLFNYFDINTVLSYLVKMNILHRWASLDHPTGARVLEELLHKLSDKTLVDRADS